MSFKNTDDPPVEVETGKHPTASIIWLHGLGADGHDFEPIMPELRLPFAARFVFPHAPYRPVTINDGHVMRAWYDMGMVENRLVQNPEHIRESIGVLNGYAEREIARGIAPGRIVFAGFSQGGVIALKAGLRYPQRLAGIMALSALVSDADALANQAHPANTGTPIFLAHGALDRLIPFDLARTAQEQLVARGLNLEWHSYPMDHTVSREEIGDIRAWLTRVLA
ncbi:MAG: dienelactone hydrolase family protein [Gammaproteobacteria bacterium]|nr:dienelactone hydrolase family protein [Gammaproteobacteria bacterium]